jgi:hypothetical protein
VLARIEVVEQALGVKRATGSGNGNENLQGDREYGRGPARRQACT